MPVVRFHNTNLLVSEVVDFDPVTMTATIRQRNVILEGDHVEFYGPGFRHFECEIKDLHDANGNKIDRAPNPMELLTITVPQEVKPGDMIRSTKEGLINLYQKTVQVRLFVSNDEKNIWSLGR